MCFERFRGHTLLTRGLSASSRVVDLGANHGDFSNEIAARFGGEFLLVEANPALAAELRRTTSFEVLHKAVGTVSRPLSFHVAKNDEASRVDPLPLASHYDAVLEQRVTVEEVSMESVLAAAGGAADVLKLDIEGSELDALEAVSDDVIAHVTQMTVEFHSHPSFGLGGGDRVEALLRRFRQAGFCAFDFSGGTRMDVLFLNTSVLRPSAAGIARWRSEAAMSWCSYNAMRTRRRLIRLAGDRGQ
ncbi:MAG: FkbM family methyltransferase [Solirubrobacteraceae bacterium]